MAANHIELCTPSKPMASPPTAEPTTNALISNVTSHRGLLGAGSREVRHLRDESGVGLAFRR
jgi:hypothetical protein